MADWEHKIDLKAIWKEYDEEEVGAQEAALMVANILKDFLVTNTVGNYLSDQLKEIIFIFEREVDDEDSFNHALNELYDWGDTDLPTPKGKMQRKVAWIATNL